MARGCLTCQKPIQSGLASVQSPKQRTSRRLQPIRRKEEGEEQKYNPADGGRCKKEDDTQHHQDHGGNRQQEGTNIKQKHQHSRQKGQRQSEGRKQYFQQYLHHQNLPILSSLNLLILLALTIFILPQTKAEGDGYRSIMYRIADK